MALSVWQWCGFKEKMMVFGSVLEGKLVSVAVTMFFDSDICLMLVFIGL